MLDGAAYLQNLDQLRLSAVHGTLELVPEPLCLHGALALGLLLRHRVGRTRPLRKATTPTSSSIEAQRPLVYRELAARGFAGSLRWKVQGARESLLDGAGGCAPVALDLAEAICLCFCCLNFCCSAAADWLLTREFPSDVKGNSEGR